MTTTDTSIFAVGTAPTAAIAEAIVGTPPTTTIAYKTTTGTAVAVAMTEGSIADQKTGATATTMTTTNTTTKVNGSHRFNSVENDEIEAEDEGQHHIKRHHCKDDHGPAAIRCVLEDGQHHKEQSH